MTEDSAYVQRADKEEVISLNDGSTLDAKALIPFRGSLLRWDKNIIAHDLKDGGYIQSYSNSNLSCNMVSISALDTGREEDSGLVYSLDDGSLMFASMIPGRDTDRLGFNEANLIGRYEKPVVFSEPSNEVYFATLETIDNEDQWSFYRVVSEGKDDVNKQGSYSPLVERISSMPRGGCKEVLSISLGDNGLYVAYNNSKNESLLFRIDVSNGEYKTLSNIDDSIRETLGNEEANLPLVDIAVVTGKQDGIPIPEPTPLKSPNGNIYTLPTNSQL